MTKMQQRTFTSPSRKGNWPKSIWQAHVSSVLCLQNSILTICWIFQVLLKGLSCLQLGSAVMAVTKSSRPSWSHITFSTVLFVPVAIAEMPSTTGNTCRFHFLYTRAVRRCQHTTHPPHPDENLQTSLFFLSCISSQITSPFCVPLHLALVP